MKIWKVALLLSVLCVPAVFAQEADLAVEKLGPAEAPAGTDVSYDVTITNVGPDAASNVTLTDPVPPGMSFVSVTQNTGPTFACDATVSCTIASLPSGASADFTFVFHIDSGTEFTNTASVSSQTFDPNDENNQSVAVTTVPGALQADMGVQKSSPAGAAADTDVAFTITLVNAGPGTATNVLLTDNLPGGMTFVSFVQDSGPTMSCGPSTCSIAAFPADTTATFTLTGHIPAGTPAGTTFTNTATLESENDPLDENNSATATVTVTTADVGVVKTGPPSAVAGTTISYSITVTNNGPDAALNVVLSDVSLCEQANCNLGTLNPGQQVMFDYDVDIPSGATTWSNTATVTTDSVDTNAANDSSTVPTTITQSADLEIAKSGPGTVAAGSNVTYTVTVTNNGPSDASNVSVTETLPPGTTFVSSTCGSTTCNLGTVVAGASVELEFVVNVDFNATSPLVNTATVSTTTTDPEPDNNEASASTDVTPAPADVSISKTTQYTSALPGSQVTYTIVVTNNGPSPATDVIVTDTLPAGTTLVSAPNHCTGNPTITCTIGAMAIGATSTIELVVTMPSTTGDVVNTANVESTTADATPGNDSSSVLITVAAATPAIPTLSPLALALLALALAALVLFALRT